MRGKQKLGAARNGIGQCILLPFVLHARFFVDAPVFRLSVPDEHLRGRLPPDIKVKILTFLSPHNVISTSPALLDLALKIPICRAKCCMTVGSPVAVADRK